MELKITGGYKEIKSVPSCITCGMPKEHIVEASKEDVVVRCLKCSSVVASGDIVSLKAKCHRCGTFISVV